MIPRDLTGCARAHIGNASSIARNNLGAPARTATIDWPNIGSDSRQLTDEGSHVTPRVCATELAAIVEQSLTSHAVVESQGRIAEFRK